MPNKQKQMLAVWGSPGSGKTVTAVKIAAELSKQKKNVVIVLCDTTAPALPALIRTKKTPECSVGAALAAPVITQDLVLKNLAMLSQPSGRSVFRYSSTIPTRSSTSIAFRCAFSDSARISPSRYSFSPDSQMAFASAQNWSRSACVKCQFCFCVF